MFKFAEKFHCVRRNARVKDTITQSTWCEKGVEGRGLFGIYHWQPPSLMLWCTPFSKFEVSIPIQRAICAIRFGPITELRSKYGPADRVNQHGFFVHAKQNREIIRQRLMTQYRTTCLEGTDGKEQLVVEFDQQRQRPHNHSPSGTPGVETSRNFFQEFSRDCLMRLKCVKPEKSPSSASFRDPKHASSGKSEHHSLNIVW